MAAKKFDEDSDRERVKKLYEFENEIYDAGYNLVAGVDEAGRGSLVGPVLVAAETQRLKKNFRKNPRRTF